jgi:hypothetical protein
MILHQVPGSHFQQADTILVPAITALDLLLSLSVQGVQSLMCPVSVRRPPSCHRTRHVSRPRAT